PGDIFDVPPDFQVGFDPAGAAWGATQSQWFFRLQSFAFPMYFDQSVGLPPYLHGLAENGLVSPDGAQVFPYTFTFYNPLVVELPTSLIVVEAPLYESASLAAIADIKARFGGKPVKALVSTHFHVDHSGGIRSYLAEWPDADLYVPGQTDAFYADL